MGADKSAHTVAKQEHGLLRIPLVDASAECLHRFEVFGERFQVNPGTRRGSMANVVRADDGDTALIETLGDVLIATGMLSKTMSEQDAGLGVIN